MSEKLVTKRKEVEITSRNEATKKGLSLLSFIPMMFLALCLLWSVMVSGGVEPLPFGLSTLFVETGITKLFDYLTGSKLSRETDAWSFVDTYCLSAICFFASIFILYKARDKSHAVIVGQTINLCLFLILLIACTLIALSY